jgi:hypothetical protein
MPETATPPNATTTLQTTVATFLVLVTVGLSCTAADAAVVNRGPTVPSTSRPSSQQEGGTLESAAAKAGNTGRAVAMSLIGLALAVSATVLAFRRDFTEAAGVFAVGIVAVLLATPAGVSLLRDTVSSLFGGQ